MPRKNKYPEIQNGQRVGSWLVIKKVDVAPNPGKRKYSHHLCRCMRCGNKFNVVTHLLVSGRSTQCVDCRHRTHGEKVSVRDGISVSVRIDANQKTFVSKLFGGGNRSMGRGCRAAIVAYIKSGLIYEETMPPSDYLLTTITIPISHKKWLVEHHGNIHNGLYNAIKHYASLQTNQAV